MRRDPGRRPLRAASHRLSAASPHHNQPPPTPLPGDRRVAVMRESLAAGQRLAVRRRGSQSVAVRRRRRRARGDADGGASPVNRRRRARSMMTNLFVIQLPVDRARGKTDTWRTCFGFVSARMRRRRNVGERARKISSQTNRFPVGIDATRRAADARGCRRRARRRGHVSLARP